MVPWADPSPRHKMVLDRFSRFCRAQGCDRPTDRQTTLLRQYTIGRVCIVVRCGLIIMCNIVPTDGTDQSHNINEIYNVHLYQSTNFLKHLVLSQSLSIRYTIHNHTYAVIVGHDTMEDV